MITNREDTNNQIDDIKVEKHLIKSTQLYCYITNVAVSD